MAEIDLSRLLTDVWGQKVLKIEPGRGSTAGIPDVHFLGHNGFGFWIELKKRWRLSDFTPAQIRTFGRMDNNLMPVFVLFPCTEGYLLRVWGSDPYIEYWMEELVLLESGLYVLHDAWRSERTGRTPRDDH